MAGVVNNDLSEYLNRKISSKIAFKKIVLLLNKMKNILSIC